MLILTWHSAHKRYWIYIERVNEGPMKLYPEKLLVKVVTIQTKKKKNIFL